VWGVFSAVVWCVLKTLESFCNVPMHGYVDGGTDVIPVKGHGEIKGAGLIFCDSLKFFEGSEEMKGLVAVCVFDTEIVDDK
jgi:hypothetical protein